MHKQWKAKIYSKSRRNNLVIKRKIKNIYYISGNIARLEIATEEITLCGISIHRE